MQSGHAQNEIHAQCYGIDFSKCVHEEWEHTVLSAQQNEFPRVLRA